MWGSQSEHSGSQRRGEPADARAPASPGVAPPGAGWGAAAEPAGGRSREGRARGAWRGRDSGVVGAGMRRPREPLPRGRLDRAVTNGTRRGPRIWLPSAPQAVAGNPDFSLGIRRESGLRARPRCAGVLGLQDIVRRACSHRGACTGPPEIKGGLAHLPRLGTPTCRCPVVSSGPGLLCAGARVPGRGSGSGFQHRGVQVRCSWFSVVPLEVQVIVEKKKVLKSSVRKPSSEPSTYSFFPYFTLACAHFSLS